MTARQGDDRGWIARLAHLASGLSTCLDPLQAAELAAETAQQDRSTSTFVFQGGRGSPLTLLAAIGPGAAAAETEPPTGALFFPEWVVRTQSAAICPDVSLDPRTACLQLWGVSTGSAIGLPVGGGSGTFGALVLVRPLTGAPAEEDLACLQAVADMLGMALEKMHLKETTDEQVRQLLALQQVSQLLTSEVDTENVLSLIVDVAASLFSLDLCCLLMYDRRGDLRVRAARGLDEAAADAFVCSPGTKPDAELFRQVGCNSVAMLPVTSQEQVLGYLAVGCREARALEDTSRSPLATWASLVGVALENNRWITEAESAQQDVVEVLVSVLEAQGLMQPGLARLRAGCASEVAVHLGLPEREVRDLYLAALLADAETPGGAVPGADGIGPSAASTGDSGLPAGAVGWKRSRGHEGRGDSPGFTYSGSEPRVCQ